MLLGVRSIKRLFSGELIVGAGNGALELVTEVEHPVLHTKVKHPSVPALKILKSTNVNSAVTSIQLLNDNTILVATAASEIYEVDIVDFQAKLVISCHTDAIYDVAFP